MPVEVKIAEQVGVFEEVVVWGHGEEVNVKEDGFGRGVEEWIGWAECVHEEEEEDEEGEEKKG
ncbi:ribonuclease H2 subunit C [Pyrenophora seminiperda CCB06]|uniref:Ribonuclease H2 subunit C n=1 Tax=Pyrenophora seminiperda CCB06 TaxID=1302712 RepID=A0A3M7MD19_9PLEO|nr:ribonuclease H2 subunit C [Pyrenophora seminiperda CCB06]